MTGVFDLGDVLELVHNRLHQRSLAQQELIEQRHKPVGHVAAEFGDQVQILIKQRLAERLREVAFVAKEFAPQFLHQVGGQRAMALCAGFAIISITRREAAGQEFTLIVDH